MTMNYQLFTQTLKNNADKRVEYILPDGGKVPAHYHITDIGSVTANFIDCGGQVRREQYVQVQLWLGADLDHRLSADKSLSIFERSQSILDLLDDLDHSDVVIEYKTQLVSQYRIDKVEVLDDRVIYRLKNIETQCLAALRHDKDIASGRASSCCAPLNNKKRSSNTCCEPVTNCCGA